MTRPAARPDGLETWKIWLYSAPNLAVAIMHIPVLLILPAYYAKHTQIGLAAIGTVLVIGRLFDAVTDPVIGFLSDRSKSRYGRRKPWILAGLPLACVAMPYLFVPPADAGAAYFLGWSMLLFMGWTLIEIPYAAWAAELSRDYHVRSRIMSIRGTLGFAGGLLFMAAPILLSPWTGSTTIGAETLNIAAWAVAIALPVLMGAAMVGVPGGADLSVQDTTLGSLWKALKINKPLRFYAGVFLAAGVAGGAWTGTVLLFTESLGLGNKFPLLLLTAWTTRVCVAPIWLKLIYRYGKHRVWAAGLLLSGLITPLALLVAPGPTALPWLIGYACVLGFVETAWMVAPPAVYGDVIDYDTLKTGADQAGSYFAINALLLKLGGAIGGGLAFWILGLLDYRVHGTNSGMQMLGLYLSFAIVPAAIHLANSVFVYRFPIDARRHGIIRRRIERRAARLPV